jgi:Protein of unknown function (DUF2934)
LKTSAFDEGHATRPARRIKRAALGTRPTLRECIELRDPTDCLLEAYDCVARCAYSNFLARDSKPGRELEDWLDAERDVLLGLSVHVQSCADSVYAMTSVPGATAARVSVGIESNWLVILAHAAPAVRTLSLRDRVASGTGNGAVHVPDIRPGARVDEDRLPSRHVCILELPVTVDASRSIAVLADGLLAIRMPKVKTRPQAAHARN